MPRLLTMLTTALLAAFLAGCATTAPPPDDLSPPVAPDTSPSAPDASPSAAFANLSAEALALVDHHVYDRPPACATPFVRQGYVNCYDAARRVPRWVAFRVIPDYRNTPDRDGRFDSFRTDPDTPNAVVHGDYTNSGFDRGHLAPFAVMGGDRDGDGTLADIDPALSDPDDELTVFQANYMSNMSPQHGTGFNRSPGVWFKLERWIQDTLVDDHGRSLNIFAGPIFGPAPLEVIGPEADIHVPPLFFQIVVEETTAGEPPHVLAFLLPHHRKAHGDIEDFLVSVDVIEALTGLDFFPDLPDDAENDLEREDTFRTWEAVYQDL